MSEPQPLAADIRRMWQELVLVPELELPPAVERFLAHLYATRKNGGAVFATFRYEPHPVLDWFIQTNRLTLPYFDFASGFVTHEAVRAVVPAIQTPNVLPTPLELEPLDVFEFEATLARELVFDGAYDSFNGTRREAQMFAGEVVDALEGNSGRDWYGFSWSCWTPWFKDVAWDRTWIGLNSSDRRIWMLCITDTD